MSKYIAILILIFNFKQNLRSISGTYNTIKLLRQSWNTLVGIVGLPVPKIRTIVIYDVINGIINMRNHRSWEFSKMIYK